MTKICFRGANRDLVAWKFAFKSVDLSLYAYTFNSYTYIYVHGEGRPRDRKIQMAGQNAKRKNFNGVDFNSTVFITYTKAY